MEGLFNLSNFNEAGENDLLDMSINEACDGCKANLPEGVTEKPSTAKIDIDADTYNNAIDRLQQTFKEAVETMDMLRNVNIVTESKNSDYDAMEQYMESAMYDYCVGPLFEKVSVSDKNEIKKIVDNIKSDVVKFIEDQKFKVREPHRYLKTLSSLIPYVGIFFAAAMAQGWAMIWQTRAFQEIGLVNISKTDAEAVLKALNEKFATELGDYKIIAYEVPPTLRDVFRNKFGWKNQDSVYLFMVDKKIPAEIEKATEDVEKELIKANKAAKEEKEKK